MRKFYVIAYDITSDKIRNKVCKTLSDYGERVQYSVFCCRLNKQELDILKNNLEKLIEPEKEAGIIFLEAGDVYTNKDKPEMSYVGKSWKAKNIGNVF